MPHRAAILLLLLPSATIAAVPGRSAPLPQFLTGENQLRETFTLGESEIRGYCAQGDLGTAVSREGRFSFLVHTIKRDPYVYIINSIGVGTGRVRLAVFVRDLEPKGSGQEPPGARRVAAKVLASPAAPYEAGRELILDCEKAVADWEAHKAFLPEALSADPQVSHEAWRRVALDLERAREKHPHHLGILQDLIGAYTRLLPLEKNSPRGTNLCALIPQRIAEFQAQAAPLSDDETRTFRRARALLYFHTGLYPLARAEIDQDKSDPELAGLREALLATGQAEFVPLAPFEVRGDRASCRVAVYAAKGSPGDLKRPFAKWFFIPRPATEDGTPEAVWFTLSCQTLTDKPRYYLYGCRANLRQLLKLYGRREPAFDEAKAGVQEVIRDTLLQ